MHMLILFTCAGVSVISCQLGLL